MLRMSAIRIRAAGPNRAPASSPFKGLNTDTRVCLPVSLRYGVKPYLPSGTPTRRLRHRKSLPPRDVACLDECADAAGVIGRRRGAGYLDFRRS